MKPNSTDITVILDESGSMDIVCEATLKGLNDFIAEQAKLPGEATFTLVKFSYHPETVCLRTPLSEVKPFTEENYSPDGNTALLDAIGTTIETLGSQYRELSEEDRPSKVIIVIQTDGEENASTKFKKSKIKEMIQHQTEVYSWEFVFLGANQDAFAVAESMGMSKGLTLNYVHDDKCSIKAFSSMSKMVGDYRSAGPGTKARGFTAEDIADQKI